VCFPDDLIRYTSDPALSLLLPNASGIDIHNPWGSQDNPVIPSGKLLFVFMPGHEEEVPRVQADYPGDQLNVVHAPDGSVLYSYYRYQPGP
jgi:hypothetical protein